jgi:hypothetical protein
MENSIEVPKKLKIDLPNDPTILLLGIDPKEHESGYTKDSCIPCLLKH